jgi:hypothetical protein
MLKIATIVNVLPIPIRFNAMEKKTISQTAFTGVWVNELTFDQNLDIVSSFLVRKIEY